MTSSNATFIVDGRVYRIDAHGLYSLEENLPTTFCTCAFLAGANFFVGISNLDVDAYNLLKKPWIGRSDNLSNFLPLALRLSNLPSDTTFNQFQSEIMSRQSKAKAEREQVLSVLNANPLTPDFLLRNRLAIIEIALSGGYEDPAYGSHCGGLFAWLQQK